ncbi:CoA ester lyase [Alcaligenaceae bacterium B3P038]|nr:CoA ester lyase [Alcaligenaceae bacterium B3P038]
MTSLRTLLFAPANHPRRVEKSFTLHADAVILDLEDACAISEKVASRVKVVEAMLLPRSCLGYVRVNPLSTEFAYGDLSTVIRPGLDGVILPKVESPGDLITADWLIGQLEREHNLPAGSVDLIPIIETGLGVAQLEAILKAPCCHGRRVKRVAFGAGDFTLDMGLTWNADEAELMMYRAAIVLASRACGLEPPIDTVWVDLQNADGFKASAARARHLGFQGKLCIYPDQVAIVNAEFTPSEADVRRAHRIIDAFAEAEAQGSSSIQLDGQFIDYPIVYRAQRVLALVANLNSAAS